MTEDGLACAVRRIIIVLTSETVATAVLIVEKS